MVRTVFFILATFLAVSLGSVANAGLKVLEGTHTVIYDIVNPRGVAFIPDYANESFEQKVISQDEFSKRVRVTAKMHPMRSRIPYPIPAQTISSTVSMYLRTEKDRQSNDPSLVRQAREITRESRYAHEAGNAILSWVADHLTFDTSITIPSDAVSAFRYRKAYCVGYSNLAVALLRAAGIPARVAHGYLPPGYEWGFSKEYWGVKVKDGGFHAYLEIFYPDTGWVFSDAEHSHHFVDPYHIILRLDGMTMPGAYGGGYLNVEKATFYTIFKDENKTVMVDELPLPRTKRLGRRLGTMQHSALVTGRVSSSTGVPVSSGKAVLWQKGRGTPFPFTDGRYTVPVPVSGTYRIELKGSGFAKASRNLQVKRGNVYRLDVTLQPGGVITGRVIYPGGRPVQTGDVFYRDGNTSYGVPIGKDGRYRIEGLSPGTYSLSVMIGDHTFSRKGRAAAGKETVIDFVVR